MRTNVALKQVEAEPLPVMATLPIPATGVVAPAKKAKLSFGNLGQPKKSGGKTVYPTVPDEVGELGNLGKTYRAVKEQLKALGGQADALAFDIKTLVKKHAFKAWNGLTQVGSGFQFLIPEEEPIKVLLTAKYSIPKGESETSPDLGRFENSMRATIGDANYERLFKDGFAVKVDGELIPVEKQQDFLNKLNDLVVELNLDAAAVVAGPTIKHVQDFHTLRHSLLTPEQNATVDELYPMVIQVRT